MPVPLVRRNRLLGGNRLAIEMLSVTASQVIRDVKGQFSPGLVTSANEAHADMAFHLSQQVKGVLDTAVKARAASHPAPDFNLSRGGGQGHLRRAFDNPRMFAAGAFGFRWDTKYLDENPITAPYWRGVDQGRSGSFLLSIRQIRKGRARVPGPKTEFATTATYHFQAYDFIERGAALAEADFASGMATQFYHRNFKANGMTYSHRPGALPRGIGAGLPRR